MTYNTTESNSSVIPYAMPIEAEPVAAIPIASQENNITRIFLNALQQPCHRNFVWSCRCVALISFGLSGYFFYTGTTDSNVTGYIAAVGLIGLGCLFLWLSKQDIDCY